MHDFYAGPKRNKIKNRKLTFNAAMEREFCPKFKGANLKIGYLEHDAGKLLS